MTSLKRKQETDRFQKFIKQLKQNGKEICDELPRFVVITLEHDSSNYYYSVDHSVNFTIPEHIPVKDYQDWQFVVTKCSNFKITDSNGNVIVNSKSDNNWISNRYNILSRRFRLDARCHGAAVLYLLAKVDCLPIPKIQNAVFSYQFFPLQTNDFPQCGRIEWSRKGKDNWQALYMYDKKLRFEHESDIIEVRRNEFGVLSDSVELVAPWKTNFALRFPFDITPLLIHKVLEPSDIYYNHLKKATLTQEQQSWKYLFNGPTIHDLEAVPGIPFRVEATFEDDKRKVKKSFLWTIPKPLSIFYHNTWSLWAGEKSSLRIRTFLNWPIVADKTVITMWLNSNGYFSWQCLENEITGYANIMSLPSDNTVVIQFSPFKQSVAFEDSTINPQEHAPLPLRNKDLLNLIFCHYSNSQRQYVRAVCKLWQRDISRVDTFRIRWENKTVEGRYMTLFSNDLAQLGEDVFDVAIPTIKE